MMPSIRTATYVFILTLVAVIGTIVLIATGETIPDFYQSVLTLLVGASAGLAVPRTGV